jgi:hypothetical protein
VAAAAGVVVFSRKRSVITMSIAPEAVREELDGEIRRIDLMLLGGGILYEREGAFICALCRARPEELLSGTAQLAQEGHVLRSGMRDRRTRRCCMRFRCEVRVPRALAYGAEADGAARRPGAQPRP